MSGGGSREAKNWTRWSAAMGRGNCVKRLDTDQ